MEGGDGGKTFPKHGLRSDEKARAAEEEGIIHEDEIEVVAKEKDAKAKCMVEGIHRS